jgi:beta-lactam-binding protein with PASTA domain
VPDYVDSALPRDQVVDQDPPANQKVAHEANVRLKVSNGTAPPPTGPTDDSKQQTEPTDEANEYTLHIKLTDTQVAVQVKVEIEDSNGTRPVYEESHDPGDEFDVDATGYGPTATFRIYYNDQLKKTLPEKAPRQTTRGVRL